MKYKKIKTKKRVKENKIFALIMLLVVLLVGSVAIPTLSSYKSETSTYTIVTWDGTVADSYREGDGTKENPYVISNASELAFFASQIELEETKYEGQYIVLNNDIVLNDGIFKYTEEGIKYIKEKTENIITPNTENDIIKKFKQINEFKGNFDGKSHTIYGLYIDEPIEEQNALFTNLEGNINNLYIENSVIYGGKIVSGVASKAKNSTISNVVYDGYVIADDNISTKTINIEIEDIVKNESVTELTDYINVNDMSYIPGIITEIKLSGNYQSNNQDGVLKINNELVNVGDFELILENEIQSNITINYQSNTNVNFSITKLNYEITYQYNNASGIVSLLEDSNLKNIINKAYVKAGIYASGITNTVSGETTLKNIYNIGTIESNKESNGLVSNINQNTKDVIITNSYNNGELISENNALIGNIENNTGSVTLENVFNPQDNYVINTVKNSTIKINNSYSISEKNIKEGTSDDNFIKTTIENLKDKSYAENTLKYEEYTENSEDENKVWIFEDEEFPKLYIDKPIANINITEYKWNKYSYELNTLKFADKFVFNVEEANGLNTIKQIEYYIHNSKEPLTKTELNQIENWTTYENIVEINQEGFYIVYAKIIDYNDKFSYINTDLLVLDLTPAKVSIISSYSNDKWESFSTNLNNYYINEEINISIEAEDSLSGIDKIYYYESDTMLSEEEIKLLENWNEYKENIKVTKEKTIVYVKVVDNCNYSTYANSDIIIFDGYKLNKIYPGMKEISVDKLYITDKSNISLNFTYSQESEYKEGNRHQLISNVLFPENTKITLIDKKRNKVYTYITTDNDYGYNDCSEKDCYATYDFTLFREVGSLNKFKETSYEGTINEEFVVNVDYKHTQIDEKVENVYIYLKMINELENQTINTLTSSLKSFSIEPDDKDISFALTTNFKDIINYNENAKYTIDFKTKLNYKYVEETKVYDTQYEDKDIGIAIKMINSNGVIVENKYLNNISIKIGEKKYSPSSDGIIRINLEQGINDITDNLIIETFSSNSKLENGEYKFVIELFTAYDGTYSKENHASIEIPIHVGKNSYNTDNSFVVSIDNEDKIITNNSNEFNFNIITKGNYNNADIKVSLYKKASFKSYDQKYNIIDLGEYIIDDNLEKYSDNIYYLSKEILNNHNVSINLNTSLLEKNGYMFVFELYEDGKIINKVNKKFIVK